MPSFSRMRLGTRFTIVLLAFFGISIVLSGLALYRSVRTTAEEAVSSNGLLLLHSMNAVRNYTSSQVNPLLVPMMDAQGKFIPESVPAFSARSVFDQLHIDGQYQDFYYKEASTNPTAPEDRADEFETQVIQRFLQDPSLPSQSGFRTLNGKLVYYNARPMGVNDPACLACHATPEAAPPAMVQRYGPLNGFGWKLGTVIAAQMVYVPAAEVAQRSWRTWISVMLISVTCFAFAVLAINLVLRRSVVRPVAQMAELAGRISQGEIDEKSPETLAGVARRSDELGQMAMVFQRMAQEIYVREQALMQQVQELRIEIDEAKKARQVAELVETDSFQNLRARATKLRKQHQDIEAEGDEPQDEGRAVPAGAEGTQGPSGGEQEQPTGNADTTPEASPVPFGTAQEVEDQLEPDRQPERTDAEAGSEPAPLASPPEIADSPANEASLAIFETLKQQLAGLDRVNGISALDIPDLPAELHPAMRRMLKMGLPPDRLAAELGLPEGLARQIAEILVDKGVLEREEGAANDTIYKVRLVSVHPRNIPPNL